MRPSNRIHILLPLLALLVGCEILHAQGVPLSTTLLIEMSLDAAQLQSDVDSARKLRSASSDAHATHWVNLFGSRAGFDAEWHRDPDENALMVELSLGEASRTSEDVIVVVPLHQPTHGAFSAAMLVQLASALKKAKPRGEEPFLERELRVFFEVRPGGLLKWIQSCDWQTEEVLLSVRLNETVEGSGGLTLRPLHLSHGFHHLASWLGDNAPQGAKVDVLQRSPSKGETPFGPQLGFPLLDGSLALTASGRVNVGLARAVFRLLLQAVLADDSHILGTLAHAEGHASVRLANAYRESLRLLGDERVDAAARARLAFDNVEFVAADLANGLSQLQEIARSNAARQMAHGGKVQIHAASQRYTTRLLDTARSLLGGSTPSMALTKKESQAALVKCVPNDRPGEALAAREKFLSGEKDPSAIARILDLVDGKRSAWHIHQSLRLVQALGGNDPIDKESGALDLSYTLLVLQRALQAGILMDPSLR